MKKQEKAVQSNFFFSSQRAQGSFPGGPLSVVRRASSTVPLNIFSPEQLNQFGPNLAGIILGRSSLKTIDRI